MKINDSWTLDSEVTTFDKNTLLDSIIMKGGTFEPIYTDPYFLKRMSDAWWSKWRPTFEKWYIAYEKEYEPLWDRNGYEEIEDHTDETGTLDTATSGKEVMDDDTTGSKSSTEIIDDDTTYSGTSKVIEQASGKDTTTHTSDRDIDVTNSVSAFDSNTYQPHDHSHTDDTLNSDTIETTYGKRVQTDGEENGNGTDDKTTTYTENTTGTDDRTTTSSGTVDTDTTGSKDYAHSLHTWGNWGILTTSQKLMESEFNVRYRMNPYELMSDIFVRELCVRVF